MEAINIIPDMVEEDIEPTPEYIAWLEAKIKRSIESIEAERFLTHDEVREKLRKRGVEC
ncbi:MAG: hypothetical protein LBV09_04645 [Deferribacteraceae bacterium]|jgi:predicted transcriptional regulator|nr:hypothetical protein [Deferribacteraceae bacterium]